MFQIDSDMTIYITRGDVAYFTVTAETDGEKHIFRQGDVIRFKVTAKKDCTRVAFQKDFPILEDAEKVDILLTKEETKIGDVISKPVDYWYEVELNPYTNPQTILGYDDDGAKIFKLFPEGRDLGTGVTEEDIPIVDAELDLASERPIQNQAVTRATIKLSKDLSMVSSETNRLSQEVAEVRARVTNIASLDEGSTTADAELIDIRVGADGKIYKSAGEAIRKQLNDIQNKHNLTYYSSFFSAVNSSATDEGENTGVVGVYTDDDGVKNIVLLDNLLEGQNVEIKEDTILRLNGKKLSFVSGTNLKINNNADVKIDGEIKESRIEKKLETETEKPEHLIFIDKGKLTVNGGIYENYTIGVNVPYVFFVNEGAELNLDGVSIYITLAGGHVTPYGIRNRKGTLYCNNSFIKVDTYDDAVNDAKFPSAYGIMNDGGEADILNTKVVCDSLRGDIGTGMYLGAGSKTKIDDCEVYGVFGGINCVGEVVINGGKYYGVAHGGLYCGFEGGTVYVENATVGSARYSGDHKQNFDYSDFHDVTGFYVGTKSYTSVYFDNCEIIGGKTNLFILRGSAGEQNNAVYFSNCDIRGKNNRVRIDNGSHRAYFGLGNNITSKDVEAYPTDGETVVSGCLEDTTQRRYIKEDV